MKAPKNPGCKKCTYYRPIKYRDYCTSNAEYIRHWFSSDFDRSAETNIACREKNNDRQCTEYVSLTIWQRLKGFFKC